MSFAEITLIPRTPKTEAQYLALIGFLKALSSTDEKMTVDEAFKANPVPGEKAKLDAAEKKKADEAARKEREEETARKQEEEKKKEDEAAQQASAAKKVVPMDVTEYFRGSSKSTRDALDTAKNADGMVPKDTVEQILARASRQPPIQQFVPKNVTDAKWKAYLAGYGDMGNVREELLEDETPLGKKRLQAAVFANVTKKSKVAATVELRRKALAFSQ